MFNFLSRISVGLRSPLFAVGFCVATCSFSPLLLAQGSTQKLLASTYSCPEDGSRWCHTSQFCVGINTGFFGYYNVDKVVIDQAKGASFEIDQNGPQDIFRNTDTVLDSNKYPTRTGRVVTMRFYSNLYAQSLLQRLPSGEFVVFWKGAARKKRVVGEGVSNVRISRDRIRFSLDTAIRGEALFLYENAAGRPHVTDIRIVPVEYEDDYENWAWTDYRVGARTNPPIFFPEWLNKMKSAEGCVIRYVNSSHANDKSVVEKRRDSSKDRIWPANSVWFEGFGMGIDIEPRHGLPWEIIAEASLQTGTYPWINFRIYSYENTLEGDSLVRDVGKMFRENYGGPIYVEYGNEIWNYAVPFDVASEYVRLNGPGSNENMSENYALRSNLLYRDFSESYGERSCLVQGVLGGQTRNPWHAQQRLIHADPTYADIVTPAAYVGDNLVPENRPWKFVAQQYDDVRLGRKTLAQAFEALRDEILTGDEGVIQKNWRNDVAPYIDSHFELARERNMCPAIYESGLNLRIDRTNPRDSRHSEIREFLRNYRLSPQQADVEREIYQWLEARQVGPAVVYSSVEPAGNGTFSYWDTIFDERSADSPRTKLIAEFSDRRAKLLKLIVRVEAQVKKTPLKQFRSKPLKQRFLKELYGLAQAIHANDQSNAKRLLRRVTRHVDGCGRRADQNDWIRSCFRQARVQRLLRTISPDLERL